MLSKLEKLQLHLKTVINIIENQPGKKLTTPNNLKEKVKIIIINKTRKVMKRQL